jgi:hypothetical protein
VQLKTSASSCFAQPCSAALSNSCECAVCLFGLCGWCDGCLPARASVSTATGVNVVTTSTHQHRDAPLSHDRSAHFGSPHCKSSQSISESKNSKFTKCRQQTKPDRAHPALRTFTDKPLSQPDALRYCRIEQHVLVASFGKLVQARCDERGRNSGVLLQCKSVGWDISHSIVESKLMFVDGPVHAERGRLHRGPGCVS